MSMKGEKIFILHCNDGSGIVHAIQNYLSAKKYQFHVITADVTDDVTECVAALGILFVTPDMVDRLQAEQKNFYQDVFKSCSAKAVILYNKESECTEHLVEPKLRSCLPDFTSWEVMNYGIQERDIRLTLLRIVELTEKSNEVSPVMAALSRYQLRPNKIWTSEDEVLVIFKKAEIDGEVQIKLQNEYGGKKVVKATELNDQTFLFRPKGMPNGRIQVEVCIGTRSMGMSVLFIKSRMETVSELLKNVSSPIDFLCSCLHCDDKESLDLELTDILTNGAGNSDPFSGLNFSSLREGTWRENSNVMFPTLLHFGAHFGLTSFCAALQELPGSTAARAMKNTEGRTPSTMAALSGFLDLASDLVVTTPLSSPILLSRTASFDLPSSDDDNYMRMDGLLRKERTENQADMAPELPPRRTHSQSDVPRRQSRPRSGDQDSSYGSAELLPHWTRRMTRVYDDIVPKELVPDVTEYCEPRWSTKL